MSTVMITQLIKRYHYKDTKLSDEQSSAILDRYLDTLDPNRSFFTQKDINDFEPLRYRLDDALEQGNMEPAFLIFDHFDERRIERADYALKLLDQTFDFKKDEDYLFDRRDAAWPKDQAELDSIWRKRVKNDVLALTLAKKEPEKVIETLRKRYERIKTRANQFHSEDAYSFFMNAYLASIEPHTSYFSPRTSENFKINMSLSLEGIGAVLQTIDEHTVVRKVVPGGPADLSSQLHAEDRIVGVAQGKDGEMVDVIGWRLDDVVQLIRGPKDSTVRLQILPKKSGLDGPTKTITIVRNKIDLQEQQAKSEVIDVPTDGNTHKIGVIKIPTFYMDFEAYGRGDPDYRSTTRDTHKLLDELKAQNVEGIVIDLRGNGGGSLPEAISLTGLFIKSGPVVQIQDKNGNARTDKDEDESIAYNGPMIVLVDSGSASASEIFAGAMQDYGRATIVGEPTYGKGTVQTMIDLNNYSPKPDIKLGQLKITMAQFFRVNGDSTQHRGVVPDIIYPTAIEDDNFGERSLDNALPWKHIHAADFVPALLTTTALDEVKARHEARISHDAGFQFLLAEAKAFKKAENTKTVSLLKDKRAQERKEEEATQRKRINTFRVASGMKPLKADDELYKDEEEQIVEDDDSKAFKENVDKIKLREAANSLVDLITLPHGKTSQLTLKSEP